MTSIGLLPASGKASRLNGVPKFLLPINKGTLLTWHIEQMLEVCDEVRVSTRKAWLPLLQELTLPSEVQVYEIEASTFSNALHQMSGNEKMFIGMPDTYIQKSKENFYKKLLDSNGDIVFAGFNCPQHLIGSVGQFTLDNNHNILDIKDKVLDCNYPYMWGGLLLNNATINKDLDNPSHQVLDWIAEGKSVKAVKCEGEYIDAGTFVGLNRLYSLE